MKRLALTRKKITLRDLVKPQLNKKEQAAIKRALKNAKKDQDVTKRKASRVLRAPK